MLDLLFLLFYYTLLYKYKDDTEIRRRNLICKERQTKPNIGLLFFSIFMGNFKKKEIKTLKDGV